MRKEINERNAPKKDKILDKIEKLKNEKDELAEKLKEVTDEDKKKEIEAQIKKIEEDIEEQNDRFMEILDLEEKEKKKQWNKNLEDYQKGQWNATSCTIGIAPIFFPKMDLGAILKAKVTHFTGLFRTVSIPLQNKLQIKRMIAG